MEEPFRPCEDDDVDSATPPAVTEGPALVDGRATPPLDGPAQRPDTVYAAPGRDAFEAHRDSDVNTDYDYDSAYDENGEYDDSYDDSYDDNYSDSDYDNDYDSSVPNYDTEDTDYEDENSLQPLSDSYDYSVVDSYAVQPDQMNEMIDLRSGH